MGSLARLGAPWHLRELRRRTWVLDLMVLVTLTCSWVLFSDPATALGLQVDGFCSTLEVLGERFRTLWDGCRLSSLA